ncbi:MAG: OmpA family protein [Myxococcota bacterium]
MESNGNVIQLPSPPGVTKGPARPKKKEDDDGEVWLVSYADMMTLLFCFLVILLSVSRIDVAKMSGLKQEMDKQFTQNAAPQKSLEDMEQELQAAVTRAGLTDQVRVRSTERGLILDLNAQVLFKPASAELNLRAMDLLDRVLAPLSAEPLQVTVEGHTDPMPIKSPLYPSNWELSAARASTVVRYMITTLGFRPNRLSATGYGDTRPLGPDGELLEKALPSDYWTEEYLAQQRRVTLVVTPLPVETSKKAAKKPETAQPGGSLGAATPPQGAGIPAGSEPNTNMQAVAPASVAQPSAAPVNLAPNMAPAPMPNPNLPSMAAAGVSWPQAPMAGGSLPTSVAPQASAGWPYGLAAQEENPRANALRKKRNKRLAMAEGEGPANKSRNKGAKRRSTQPQQTRWE